MWLLKLRLSFLSTNCIARCLFMTGLHLEYIMKSHVLKRTTPTIFYILLRFTKKIFSIDSPGYNLYSSKLNSRHLHNRKFGCIKWTKNKSKKRIFEPRLGKNDGTTGQWKTRNYIFLDRLSISFHSLDSKIFWKSNAFSGFCYYRVVQC